MGCCACRPISKHTDFSRVSAGISDTESLWKRWVRHWCTNVPIRGGIISELSRGSGPRSDLEDPWAFSLRVRFGGRSKVDTQSVRAGATGEVVCSRWVGKVKCKPGKDHGWHPECSKFANCDMTPIRWKWFWVWNIPNWHWRSWICKVFICIAWSLWMARCAIIDASPRGNSRVKPRSTSTSWCNPSRKWITRWGSHGFWKYASRKHDDVWHLPEKNKNEKKNNRTTANYKSETTCVDLIGCFYIMGSHNTMLLPNQHTRYSDNQWQFGSFKLDPKVRKIQVVMQKSTPTWTVSNWSCWSVKIGLL